MLVVIIVMAAAIIIVVIHWSRNVRMSPRPRGCFGQ